MTPSFAPPVQIRPFRWNEETYARDARLVRFEVFVDEQHVPSGEELDEFDPVAHHVLVLDSSGVPLGTGRTFSDLQDPTLWHLGRMAVRALARGAGIGSIVLESLIATATASGAGTLTLSSQVHAIPFYARFGFTKTGPEYADAGIPHQRMARQVG